MFPIADNTLAMLSLRAVTPHSGRIGVGICLGILRRATLALSIGTFSISRGLALLFAWLILRVP